MRGKLKRKFAVVMASVLALSNIQTAPVFAAVEEERTIIRFEELPKKYAVQELELGAAEEDIRFPGSLWADMVIVKQTNEGSKTEETEETEETADAVKTESAGETGTGTDEDLTEVGTPAETKAAQPQTEKSRYQEPQTSSAAEVGKIVPQQGGEGAEDE